METFRGIAVFPGVAIGSVLVLDHEDFLVSRRSVRSQEIPSEIQRFDNCLLSLAREIQSNARKIRDRLSSEVAGIFEAHERILTDPSLRRRVVDLIQRDCNSAESAVIHVLDEYADFVRALEGTHFADRASDLVDIKRLIVNSLAGKQVTRLRDLPSDAVILATDLTPSETAALVGTAVRGLATETGGRTSHTAIVAGALELPAVVGLGQVLDQFSDGQTVIVDGNRGLLLLDPDETTLRRYQNSARDYQRQDQDLARLRELPAQTVDGVRIQLMGNIEFPSEAKHCLERGADGIGLYRTEFLYLNNDHQPSEDEHYEAYASVLRAMGPDHPVVFRTFDMGADKLSPEAERSPEPNPVLGLRSIRLSLKTLDIFKTQLRALLRASVLGDMRIMFPLVTTVLELRRCRMILADVMEDLEEEGIDFRRDIPVGMMVEVPSAALLADQFARNVDFFSIGTNDLIQYTLAVDRTNEKVASLYSASDPAVLKLVRTVIKAANRHKISVSICGEMSGDPMYTLLLLGMGLRQLSVTPHKLPEIKQIIRGASLGQAEAVANLAKRLDTAGSVTNLLRNRLKPLVPEYADDFG